MKVFFVVVLLVERLIFPQQHYTRVTVLSGELMFILGSQIPTFPKQGMTDLDEYRCLLYSAAPISQDGVEAAEEKTFIFFCSDNGACNRGTNGPLNGFKGSLWEGGHRVPAAAYWPGRIKAGSVSDETVLGMDVFPTMASITGAKLSSGLDLDGVDLSGLLFEGKPLPERTLFWAYRNETAVRKGPWKLLVQGDDT